MMNWKNVLSVCAVYIATVIGAGFATGQEISVYFVSCGARGIFGVGIAGIFIAFCCFSILSRVLENNLTTYPQYLRTIMPECVSNITGIIIAMFLLCGFCVMISAGGTVLEEHYGMSKSISCAVLCALCWVIFIRPIHFLVKVNTVLAPLIIVGMLVAGICVIFLREESISVFASSDHAILGSNVKFFWMALLYVSYNILLSSVILVSLRGYIKDKRTIFNISMLSGLIMFVLLGLIFAVIEIYDGKIELGQIPMLTIMARFGGGAKTLYASILLLAIFTTAIGNGYGFIDWFSHKSVKRRIVLSSLLCLAAMLLTRFSFADLVKYLYGAFGVCGLYLLVCITIDGITLMVSSTSRKQTKNDKKNSI